MRPRPEAARRTWASEDTSAAVVIAAAFGLVVYVLGRVVVPELGIRPSSSLHFFPEVVARGDIAPEPVEQQRYLLALAAALALPVVIAMGRAWLARRGIVVPTRLGGVVLAGMVLLTVVALGRSSGRLEELFEPTPRAVLIGATLVTAGWVSSRRLARRPPPAPRRVETLAAGTALVAAALLCSVGFYTDGGVAQAVTQTAFHMPFTFQEAYAVAGGHTPLVDWTPQYSALLPYLLAPFLLLKPPSIAMFTIAMTALSVLALMCVYVAMRRFAASPARGLLLFVPVLAMTVLPVVRHGEQVHSAANYFAGMPIRYLGPYLCLAGLALAAERLHRRGVWIAGGALAASAALMNVEFGLPAAAALFFAALTARLAEVGERRRRAAAHAALAFAGGAAMAAAAFVVLTLAVSGHLPQPGELLYFNRQFAAAGFFMLPMTGFLFLPAVVFATFAAALVVGAAPVLSRAELDAAGRRETALLTFAGIFGVGAFGYFAGRSHPDVLVAIFGPWAIALAFLAERARRHLKATRGIPSILKPACWLAVAVFGVAGTAAVLRSDYGLEQPGRIAGPSSAPIFGQWAAIRLAKDCVPRGADAGLLVRFASRVAYWADVKDHFIYNSPGSVVTAEQLNRSLDVLLEHDVRALIAEPVDPSLRTGLEQAGFRPYLTRPADPVVNAAVRPEAIAQLGSLELTYWQRGDAPPMDTCR